MAQHSETNFFSTAFIDLICVALCSYLVMWITLEELPPPRARQARIRLFELTQFGVCHVGQGGDVTLQVAGRNGEALDLQGPARASCASIGGATVQWLEGEEGKFTGGLRIIAPEGCEEFTISLPVEGCTESGDLHYIRAESSHLGGHARMGHYLCENRNDLGVGQVQKVERLPAPVTATVATLEAIPTGQRLVITVRRMGLITVQCAQPDGQLTSTFREMLKKARGAGLQQVPASSQPQPQP